MKLLVAFLLLGCASTALAQGNETISADTLLPSWVNPENQTICGLPLRRDGSLWRPERYEFVSLDKSPPVCLVLEYPVGDVKTYKKMVFYPDVDRFALLHVADSWVNDTMDNMDMRIRLEIGTTYSPWQRVYSTDHKFVVSFFTAIVELDGNNVKQIFWDESCLTCSGEQCVDGRFCGVGPVAPRTSNTTEADTVCAGRKTAGGVESTGYLDCDLKVYLGWTGMDSKDNYLTSAAQRYSAFRRYSVKSAYESAAETLEEARPRFPSKVPDVLIPN